METAFLYGRLAEEVYMVCPEAHEKDEALHLVHAIYGLVQAARQYYKKFVGKLRKIGFTGGYPDPCLMTRRNDKGICFIAIRVDDLLLVGDKEAIDQAIADLKGEDFKLKLEGTLDDYLSCEITMSPDKTCAWLHQPHLITKIERKFGPVTIS